MAEWTTALNDEAFSTCDNLPHLESGRFLIKRAVLVIRQAQMAALGAVAYAEFEERALALVRAHWPATCESMTEGALRHRIERAFNRGREHALCEEYDLMRYLNLTFALGPDFDVDPRYPWAAILLRAQDIAASARVDRLCQHAARALAARGE